MSVARVDTPNTIEQTTTTNASGNYAFQPLAAGSYILDAFLSLSDGSQLGASENVELDGMDVTAPVLALVRIIPRKQN